MDIVLIRHPAPEIAAGVCYGRLDVPARQPCMPPVVQLDARLQALLADVTDGQWPTRWYSSPAQRCHTLARQLTTDDIVLEPALQELDFGAWEGQAWEDVARAELDAWAADVMGYCAHGGESAAAMRQRVARWADGLASGLHGDGAVLAAVTHAGVIRQLASHWLGQPLEAVLNWPLAYGAISVLRVDAAGVALRAWNR